MEKNGEDVITIIHITIITIIHITIITIIHPHKGFITMSSVLDEINAFRASYKIEPVERYNRVMSDYCQEHCWWMAGNDVLEHAPDWAIKGWKEAVAMCYFSGRWSDTIHCLIFEVLGQSEPHRKILLESKELAYGIFQFKNKVWITVRGR